MVETMAEAFEFTYKRVEQRKEQKEVGGTLYCVTIQVVVWVG